jgi:hypothetical protein
MRRNSCRGIGMNASYELIRPRLGLLLCFFLFSAFGKPELAGDEISTFPSRPTVKATSPEEDPGRPQGPVKRALIIAISDYGTPPPDPDTGVPSRAYRRLNSVNDTTLVIQALESQGFDRSNVAVLLDQDATVEGIRTAFAQLVRDSNPGDIVVVHFSGHGHQIADQDVPLEEPDGYDELLVPHGAPAEFSEGYDGSLHIRDDEVGLFLNALREKVGPQGNVNIFLDSCFSGTGTRGSAVVRGEREPLGPPAPGGDRTGIEPGFEAVRGVTRGESRERLAPFAFLAAASHRQEAFETTYQTEAGVSAVGSLSFALAWALPRMGPGATYRDLHTEVKRALNGKINLKLQTPQLEGSVDRELFSSRLRIQQPFYEVQSVLEGGRAVVTAGSLLGLGENASVEFHRPGATPADAVVPLATGRVVRAEPLRALVEVDSPSEALELEGAHVFAMTHTHSEVGLRVDLDESLLPEERDDFLERLTAVGVIELTEEAPDVVVWRGDGGVSATMAQGGETIAPRAGQSLGEALIELARNRYLRKIHLSHDEIRIEFQLAPVKTEKDLMDETVCGEADWRLAGSSDKYLGGGQWRMAPGEAYKLRIVNDSDRPVFVSVVDLMPLGRHSVLVPQWDASAGSIEVAPQLSFELGCFMVDPEPGHETLKLFATTTELDLRPLFGSGPRRSGSALSALEVLIDHKSRPTRSGPVTTTGAGATADLHIQVDPGRPPVGSSRNKNPR